MIKMMKSILVFIAAVGVFNTSMAQTQTLVARNGALKVQDGKIVNQQGVTPQLRGISFSWSLWQGRKYYNPAVVNWLVHDFKVSIIRASMGVQPIVAI